MISRFGAVLAVGLLGLLGGSAVAANIDGNGGVNCLGGTSGADTIRGFGAPDLLLGGPGNDVVNGGAGSDSGAATCSRPPGDNSGGLEVPRSMYLGTGNDKIMGGRGADELFGQDGNDVIFAQADNTRDIVRGNSGFDVCHVKSEDVAAGCEQVIFYP